MSNTVSHYRAFLFRLLGEQLRHVLLSLKTVCGADLLKMDSAALENGIMDSRVQFGPGNIEYLV